MESGPTRRFERAFGPEHFLLIRYRNVAFLCEVTASQRSSTTINRLDAVIL